MQVALEPTVKFEIVVDFPDCDVDIVFSEIGGLCQGQREVQGKLTPTQMSVDHALHAVYGNKQLCDLDVEAYSDHGLMMGSYKLMFETELENLHLKMDKTKQIIESIMKEHVTYYEANTTVGSPMGIGLVTH